MTTKSTNLAPKYAQFFGKQIDNRIARMQAGSQELKLWLEDLLRQGVATFEQLPDDFWHQFSKRMVDQQLSGVGRQVLAIKQIVQDGENVEQVLATITNLYLLARGFENWSSLQPAIQCDILLIAGVNPKKEVILQQNGISDLWIVASMENGLKDQLQFRKVWLLGSNSNRKVQILDFVFGHAAFETSFEVGMVFQGEIVYYPGNLPYRGLIKKQSNPDQPFHFKAGTKTFADMANRFSLSLSKNPWINAIPCLLEKVVPIYDGQSGHLLDQDRKQIRLEMPDHHHLWRLLALSGHHPINLFGEWNGRSFCGLTVVQPNQIIPLALNYE